MVRDRCRGYLCRENIKKVFGWYAGDADAADEGSSAMGEVRVVCLVRRRRFVVLIDGGPVVGRCPGGLSPNPPPPKIVPENSASRKLPPKQNGPEFTPRLVDHRTNHYFAQPQCRRSESRTTVRRCGNREASRIRMRGLLLLTSWLRGRGPSFCLRS